jgi:hypothetical protein
MKTITHTFTTKIIAGALMLFTVPGFAQNAKVADTKIRPFHISVPEATLTDLRQRVLATRWPDKETVTDQSQGVKLDQIQALVKYWDNGYDWRKAEARLNALPQFSN